jgi:branched-chain amino acid transport system substrate-binding protein
MVALSLLLGLAASIGISSSAGASNSENAKPVVLGIVYDGTGSFASSSLGLEIGVQAWAKWVNAHGGIAGRKVTIMAENDGSDPTTALADTRNIISSGAAGIVVATGEGSVLTSAIDTAKIPAVGGIQDALSWGTDANFFASGTTPVDYAASATDLGLPKDKKLGVFYCAESSSCSLTLPLFKAGITAGGGTYAGQWSVSATAASYTAQCLAAQSAGADAILWNVPATEPLRIAPACASQGYKPQYVTTATIVTNQWLKVSSLNGTLITYQNAPYFGSASDFPGLTAFNAAMKKYEKSFLSNPDNGQITLTGWTSGLLFGAAVQAANVASSQPVTTTDVYNGLYKLKGVTLDGLSGPITFTKSGAYHFTCYFTGEISKGKEITAKSKPSCPAPINL